MKHVLMICLSIMFLATGVNKAQANQDGSKYAYTTLSVEMHCGDCANKVKTQLAYTKGVKEVTTDYVKNEVLVKYNTKKCSEQKLIESLAEINYTATVKGKECTKKKSGCGSSCGGHSHSGCGSSNSGCSGHTH